MTVQPLAFCCSANAYLHCTTVTTSSSPIDASEQFNLKGKTYPILLAGLTSDTLHGSARKLEGGLHYPSQWALPSSTDTSAHSLQMAGTVLVKTTPFK